jgi:hypothetical protein
MWQRFLSGRRRSIRSSFRPQVERLEQRACPAVTAVFQAGILSVVGDAGNNVVEVSDSGDGQVQVVGDGQTFEFSGVDEILIQTLAGDDRVSYHARSFQIISAGKDTKLEIDAGTGDDLISISDGATHRASRGAAQIQNSLFIAKMQLGTGRDLLAVAIGRHDQVDLDVLAADPGDDVTIGLLLPAVQRVRQAAARLTLDLGGVGDLVNVTTVNYDDVEVVLNTQPPPAVAAVDTRELERISLTFQKIDWALNRDERFAARLAVQASLGAADDRVAVQSQGFLDVVNDISLGEGDDRTEIRHRMFAIVDRSNLLDLDLNLGAGDDRLLADSDGCQESHLAIDAGEGDDLIQVQQQAALPKYWVFGTELPRLEVSSLLGIGSDTLVMTTRGFRQIATDIDTGPIGDGRDLLLATHVAAGLLPISRRNLVTTHSFDLDRATVIAIGYESVDVRTEQTRQITIIQDL